MSNFHKIFNSETTTGRANVAKATYASIAMLYIFYKLRKRSKKASCPDCGCTNCGTGAGGAVNDPLKSEPTCDPEAWKNAIYGDKPTPTAGGPKAEVPEAKHISNKVEEGADLKAVNMSDFKVE